MSPPFRIFARARGAIAGFVAFFLATATGIGPLAAEPGALTVVELFTSQGCSSCPAADALLGRLAKRPDVLALSLHVDYWDYIGWPDPFADPKHTERQYAYMRAFHQSYVYTPQMVIQGAIQATGSDEAAVQRAIEGARQEPRVAVSLRSQPSGALDVAVGAADGQSNAGIYLVLFDPMQTTKIHRGENRGRKLTNYNVVRSLERIGDWHGAAATVTVPAEQMKRRGKRGCAVLVQSEPVRAIIGAARLDSNTLSRSR